jgi:hypothetical protein
MKVWGSIPNSASSNLLLIAFTFQGVLKVRLFCKRSCGVLGYACTATPLYYEGMRFDSQLGFQIHLLIAITCQSVSNHVLFCKRSCGVLLRYYACTTKPLVFECMGFDSHSDSSSFVDCPLTCKDVSLRGVWLFSGTELDINETCLWCSRNWIGRHKHTASSQALETKQIYFRCLCAYDNQYINSILLVVCT